GCMMTPVMAAVQNSSTEKEMGMNTSAVNVLRSIGTSLGTAIFTMLINAQYANNLGDLRGAQFFDVMTQSIGTISDKATEFLNPMLGFLLSGSYDDAQRVLHAFIDAADFGFIAGGCIILIAAVVGFFIKVQRPPAVVVDMSDDKSDVAVEETEEAPKEQ
ncbi:MAG: hypothetical protein MJZ68_01925, partial [archaeon]|nr:hypothetical protein [archaeon]